MYVFLSRMKLEVGTLKTVKTLSQNLKIKLSIQKWFHR